MRPFPLLPAIIGSAAIVACGFGDAGSASRAAAVTPAATLTSPRAAHTMTALADGRVLVIGGFGRADGQLAGTEYYDPELDQFEAAATGLVPRQSHTATRLDDGSVIVVGGYDRHGEVLGSVQRFDPRSGEVVALDDLITPRAGHVAVGLDDGSVLVIGGMGAGWGILASVEVIDPSTGAGRESGSMSVPRESHTAVSLTDGRVLVVGGHSGPRGQLRVLASAEIYDPSRDAWSRTGSLVTARHKHDAIRLQDGRILILGGADERDSAGVYRSTELYDPEAGTFSPHTDMVRGRYKHAGTTVRLVDGRFLLAGGAQVIEVYDPRAATFSVIEPPARLHGQFSAAAILNDGRVLITGGYGGDVVAGRRAWIVVPEDT